MVLTITSLSCSDFCLLLIGVGAWVMSGARRSGAIGAAAVFFGDATLLASRAAAVRVTNSTLVATSALDTVTTSDEVSKFFKTMGQRSPAVLREFLCLLLRNLR
jgi:hypothetical protein